MIRTCPICSAFYATPGLAFCVADGAPLVVIDPGSEKWEQGRRYFEKAEEMRKQIARKTKRRRGLVVTASVLVVAMVVSVVTVNALILLKVLPNNPVADPSPSPPVAVANPQPTPDIQGPTPGAGTPESSPVPTPTATPSPLPSPKANPTITPVVIGSPTPPSTPTNTTPEPTCSAADREREKAAIIGRYAEKWSSAARAVPPKPPPSSVPGVETEITFAGAEYSTTVLNGCAVASVNAHFNWQFRQTYNGTSKISTLATQRTYTCAKNGSSWICH